LLPRPVAVAAAAAAAVAGRVLFDVAKSLPNLVATYARYLPEPLPLLLLLPRTQPVNVPIVKATYVSGLRGLYARTYA
jgi:hypothetical protein